MEMINGYRLDKELSAENAGFSRWGFCEKNGHTYFIKEFLSPVYPTENKELSPSIIERKKRVCDHFYTEKKEFYDRLRLCRSGNNIVVLDFFRWGSRYYAVTDKVNSSKMSFTAMSGMEEDKKRVVTRSILHSMSLLHGAGIVHADIKPDNVLLKMTENGYCTAKIIDFDAGFLVGKTPKEVQGDFLYLAPETYIKIRDEDDELELTQKIDIFALGILLHQYWSGEKPEFGIDYRYAFEAALDDAPIRLSPYLPEDIWTVIGKMLKKEPDDRPTAAEAFALVRARSAVEPKPEPTPPEPKPEPNRNFGGFHAPDDLG